MNIILMENVEKLGQVGDVVKVKDGYARNYLLPRQLGMPATDGNMKRIEREKTKRLAVYEAEKKEAELKAEQLSKVSVTIAVEVNDQEKLYGAISDTDIIDAMHKEGQQIDKKSLVIEKPIDDLGIFEIGVKLHPQVIAKIRLWVTKKAKIPDFRITRTNLESPMQTNEQGILRVPPQNIDAEKAVLGAMMISEEAIGVSIEHLDSFYFYETAHQKIFDAVRELYAERKRVDIITLSDWLKNTGQLENLGGLSYLSQLADFVPTAANAQYYVDIVKEKGIQRQLIKNATEIISKSYSVNVDIEELVDSAEQLIFEIANANQKQQAIHIKDIIKGTIENIELLFQHKKSITGVPTGFADFDKITSGLQNADLVIIAGRPSMGKSAFAVSIAENACIDHNVPVAIFSLEMSKEQLVQRMLCSQAHVDSHKVRTGFLSPADWPLLTKAAGRLSNAPIFIDDTPAISMLELRAKARRLKAAHNIGLVIVDYLQLMQGHGKTESRQQEISEISRSLKALARELRVPLIAISQLSRAVESRQDHRPQLSDLRESGAIEQDADVVVLLVRDEYYSPTDENRGIATAIIAKQRNGPTGDVKMKFFKEYVKFANLETAHHE